MASASAWGIDLGNRALKAVKLVREGDRFRIDEFEILEHEQILSIAGDNKESLQKTALAKFIERHSIRGSAVGVSVSGQSSFARFIKLPPVEPKKIPEIVRFEAVQQIPFPLDDVEWSYQLFQEKDSPDVEVGIFAMRKELINRHITMFTDLGLNVQVVQMNPLAIYNGMFYDDHVTQTTMFMDCGAENTDLIIADGETVWLRTLPIGGNNFTETLAKNFKLNFTKAEELKRNAATSKYAKQIFQAMRPVFADLVAEIQRSIGFYASVHRDARIQRIVALGSTFQLPGLQKYLQQNLQLPVEKLDAFKALPPADAKAAAELPENVATLSGAYGLAMQAMGEAKIASSLLPEKIRRMKMWQEKTKWFATAAAMFLAGAIGAGSSYYYHNYMYERNDSVRSDYQQILSTASGLANEWKSKIQNIGEADRKKILTLRTLQDHHSLWVDIATQILTAIPNKKVEELKKVPRAQREQITLDSIQSRYWADLTEPLDSSNFADFVTRTESSMPTGGGSTGVPGMPFGANPTMMMMMMRMGGMRGMPGMNMPGAMPGMGMPGMGMPGMGMPGMPGASTENDPMGSGGEKKGKRGFLVAIRGSTPRQAADGPMYISNTLLKNLRDLTAEAAVKQGKPFFVAKAELIRSQRRVPLGTDSEVAAESLDPDMLGGAEGDANAGAYTPPVDANGNPLYHPNQDRNFPDEITEADTIFTVLAAISLDPATPKKEGESSGESSEQ